MSLSDYLLSTLGVYGLPVLFAALLIGAVGIPLPGSLMLLAAGSFTEQGDMNLYAVLALSAAGSILGDNIGYALGRWGGHRLSVRISRFIGSERHLKAAEEWLIKREGAGIFLSRWLITPLAPFINITCGMTGYSWPRFLLYDVLGEALWVVLYVLLGRLFSDRVQEVGELLGDFVWMIVGLLFAVALGWKLLKYFRSSSIDEERDETRGTLVDEAR
ncbi:MAG: DedA family protein [Pyrinomonadaceae bacterium]|nr:DedA family protein [Pyrinomonadaceae bacterium]